MAHNGSNPEGSTVETDAEAEAEVQEAVNNVQEAISDLQTGLEQLEDANTDRLNNRALADFYADLRAVEKATEDARKDDLQEVIEDRVDTGEKVEGDEADVILVEGHNKYVKDGQAAVEALDSDNVDMWDVMEVNASDLAEVAEEHDNEEAAEQVGRHTYTYGRVQ